MKRQGICFERQGVIMMKRLKCYLHDTDNNTAACKTAAWLPRKSELTAGISHMRHARRVRCV